MNKENINISGEKERQEKLFGKAKNILEKFKEEGVGVLGKDNFDARVERGEVIITEKDDSGKEIKSHHITIMPFYNFQDASRVKLETAIKAKCVYPETPINESAKIIMKEEEERKQKKEKQK